MTQLQLVEKMCVTDKAVSKWERDLSYPDINSISKLAEIFDLSVDELIQIKKDLKVPANKLSEITKIAPNAIALAMGIAVIVLALLDELPVSSGMIMLGIGLSCVGISFINQNKQVIYEPYAFFVHGFFYHIMLKLFA